MGYGNYIIGMLLAITVAGVLFASMSSMATEMGVTINSSYVPTYATQLSQQQGLIEDVSSQAPGGEEGISPSNTQNLNFDYGLGYSTSSTLMRTSANFRTILFGNETSDQGSIIKQFGIPTVWGGVIATIFILSIALLGIGIILNRYL